LVRGVIRYCLREAKPILKKKKASSKRNFLRKYFK